MKFDRPRAAVAMTGFCAFMNLYAPQAVLPQLTESLHISPAEAGTTIGVSTLAVACAAPVVGMLADRFGNKTTIVAAAYLLIIPTLLLVFVNSLDQILVLRFVQGLLVPAIFSPVVAYISDEFSPDEAADLLGLYVAGNAVGGFSGRFVTALLADHLGWRAGFGVLTVMTVVFATGIWAWMPAERRRLKAGKRGPGGLGAVALHLRNPALLATFVAGFALLFSMVATFTYVNFKLAGAPYFLSAAQLGMIFMVYLIGAAISPASGFLMRRLHRRKSMLLAAGLACMGIGVTLLPSLPAIIGGLALFVTGVFLAQSLAMGFVGQAASSAKATAVGLYVCVYYVGGSGGAVLPGLVWHSAGWPGCVAMIVAVLCLSAAMAWRAWADESLPAAEHAAG